MPTASLGISGPRGAGKTTLLRNFCDATRHALDHDLRHPETPRNFCAAVYFYATVVEVFGPGLTTTVDVLRARGNAKAVTTVADDNANIDWLAYTRNALSGNPDIAWELITRFRGARGLILPARPWRSDHDIPAMTQSQDLTPADGTIDA
jgi:hypothetical protein